MAASILQTQQYISSEFVESAGAVLFHLSHQKICILHLKHRNQYLLAKGRRNHGESRQSCALREVTEETGYQCRIYPVTLHSRTPPAVEIGKTSDSVREFENSTEPFAVQVRELSKKRKENNVKFIWWYIAAVEEDKAVDEERPLEQQFEVQWYSYTDVLEKLTFQNDRDIVKLAIELVVSVQH